MTQILSSLNERILNGILCFRTIHYQTIAGRFNRDFPLVHLYNLMYYPTGSVWYLIQYRFNYLERANYWTRGINQVDCIESLMIAYESKINIFKEMRYFLMFYLNLGFIVCWELVLFILSNFSFLSIRHSFSRTFVLLLCNFFSKITLHVFLNFICNHSLSFICIELQTVCLVELQTK